MLQDRKNTLREMNQGYIQTSNNAYKIDGLFRPTDVVIPTDHTDMQQCSNLILTKVTTPMPRMGSEHDGDTTGTRASESDNGHTLGTKPSSAGKGTDSTCEGTPES